MILFSPLRWIAFGSLIALAQSATVGTSFLPRSISGVPDAAVFFPLTASGPSGADITSQGSQQTLLGSINGTASWISDSLFGYVLACSKERTNSIILDPVTIGTQGPFAVNLWFKANYTDNNGNAYAYLLSALTNATQRVSGGSNVYIPNSLQLMLPEAANNRTGLVRSIVKDSNDQNQTSTLDSDGKYNNNDPWGANAVYKNVSDGAWHMVTVTTRTDVQHGFLLYIDGQAAAQLPPSGIPDEAVYYGPNNSVYYEDGGNPINLTGNVYLCARTDADSQRFFSGSIAQLGFFNVALNSSSIQALYTAVTSANSTSSVSNTSASIASAAPVSSPATIAAASPAINLVPSAALTNATSDSSPAAQQHGHGLSKGAIAGIVIGSIAGAVLLMTLATFVILKKLGPAGHARLQEAPSSKFLMHSSSMDRQAQMSRDADAKAARTELYNGPTSSDYNIKAKA